MRIFFGIQISRCFGEVLRPICDDVTVALIPRNIPCRSYKHNTIGWFPLLCRSKVEWVNRTQYMRVLSYMSVPNLDQNAADSWRRWSRLNKKEALLPVITFPRDLISLAKNVEELVSIITWLITIISNKWWRRYLRQYLWSNL